MNEQEKSWKFPLSAVWVLSTITFCAIFAITMAPRVQAQNRENQQTQYTTLIRNVFDFVQRNYVQEVDPKILYEGAMTGMFESLGDPYSAFLPASEMSDITDTTQGSFGGVGLLITKPTAPRPDGRPNYLEVVSPIEDTPGWRAGINPGDLIIRINDESTEMLSSDEAVTRLRGQPGTQVNLLIRRGERVEFPVTLTRAIIEVPTVKHDMIGDIGYLKLLTFTPYTADRARDAINDFRARGYSAIILDLRNNYGGRLDAAVDVSNLFFEGRAVVSIRSRIARDNQTLYARGRSIVPADIPIIVLINRGSASASEIVAGALKDHGRAYLVGEKSYGKGSVQQVFPLDDAGFKLTTALYYTPSNVNIDRIGIPPDREVLFPDFSEADADRLNSLLNSGRIAEFIRNNPNANAAERDAYARNLNREYGLDISLLQRLIRNEQNRTTIAPVYDLDYDVQLQEAVRILREENFRTLMQSTKTIDMLQQEAMQEVEFPLAS